MSEFERPLSTDASATSFARGPGQAPPRRSWRFLVALVLLVVLVAVMIVRRPKPPAGASAALGAPVATIRVASAQTGNMGVYLEALGTVTPVATVNLYSQVNGRVDAVHYVEGQMVRKGDPLVDLDARPYEAQLQEVQGTLQHDRAVLAQAEMDLARYKEASEQQAISRQTYEDQVQTVEQDRGTVNNDMGQVAYAQVQLSYCHITSPISGRMGLRLVDPGNTVFSGSSSAIAVITQLQPITVVFNVAEDGLSQVHDEILRRGALPVEVFDRSQQVKLASGKLLTLDNQVDTSTGTIRFRGQFENTDLKLFPNQFVNARMLVKTLSDAVLVPSAAVQRNGTQAFVYVVHGDQVSLTNLTELATENGQSAVTVLAPGAVVAVSGFDKLQDGSKIKLDSPQPTPAVPASPTPTGPQTQTRS